MLNQHSWVRNSFLYICGTCGVFRTTTHVVKLWFSSTLEYTDKNHMKFYYHWIFCIFLCIFFDSHTGALLAKREEIAVVIVNSRLGALGYLYDGPGTGNMGLWDNILALQYIQDNIAAYGGDPNKVTKSAQRIYGDFDLLFEQFASTRASSTLS